MGNFVSAIENGTTQIVQMASGGLLAGLSSLGIGSAAAVGTAAILAGPIGLGLLGGAIGAGIVGGIVWYMRLQDSHIDFRQALHEKRLDFLYDNLTQIKEMYERVQNKRTGWGNAGNYQAALQALHQIAAQHREFSELFYVFRLAIDADFRCVRCSHALQDILQICLCHTKNYPSQMRRWTCHCLNERHSCCALN